jgi:predicted transposase/invertase (TIGR01784 family)
MGSGVEGGACARCVGARESRCASGVHVLHDDGTRTNVEMHTYHAQGMRQRALFHWARMYANALPRGSPFSALPRVRVIFFLSYRLLPGARLHSRFRALEVEDGHLLDDTFEIHTIELPKLQDGVIPARDAGVASWARFFAADDDAARREVAMTDSRMEQMLEALDLLSADGKARYFAKWREGNLRFDEWARAKELHDAEVRATAQGREEGRAEGREEARGVLRAATLELAAALGLEVDAAREVWLGALDLDALRALPARLARERRWPD